MYDKVVSTKLTDEEHNNLLELCNRNGCTPSKMIRNVLLEKIEVYTHHENSGVNNEANKELNVNDIRKAFGLMDKNPKPKLKSNSCIFTKCNGNHKINK